MIAPNKNVCIVCYSDTLLSKNKIKKFLLVSFLLNYFAKRSTIRLVLTTQQRQKNVFLNSPFHFKTVKTHLYIPTYKFQITISYNSPSQLHKIMRFIQSFQLVGSLQQKTHLQTYSYKI